MGRKRNKQGTKDGGVPRGGWEMVYSGFILIFLCFFIMLCSFSRMEESKVTRFVKSFSHAVNILSGGLDFESGDIVLHDSEKMVDENSEVANIYKNIKSIVKELKLENDVTLLFSDDGLVMRLSDKILFDLGGAAISVGATPLLQKIGLIISKTSYSIRIEGHTDNFPINRVKFPSNWELSTARAVSVLRYFIEKNNIPSERLSAAGFGEFHPLLPNDLPENRAKNRRVELVFINDDYVKKVNRPEDKKG